MPSRYGIDVYVNRKYAMNTIKSYGFITIAGILLITQYILGFFVYKLPGIAVLQWIGCGIWVLSGIFGIAPIFIFRQRGGVAKGKSYVVTNRLVDTSLYAIVRHPQYMAGILFGVAMMLLAQHRLVILLGIITAVLIWLDIQIADQQCIGKFGEKYRRYMERVPQVNFLLGVLRLIQAKQARKKI
jgi:protein-S-isoprenylcysteine O-methyltransferase Ste14